MRGTSPPPLLFWKWTIEVGIEALAEDVHRGRRAGGGGVGRHLVDGRRRRGHREGQRLAVQGAGVLHRHQVAAGGHAGEAQRREELGRGDQRRRQRVRRLARRAELDNRAGVEAGADDGEGGAAVGGAGVGGDRGERRTGGRHGEGQAVRDGTRRARIDGRERVLARRNPGEVPGGGGAGGALDGDARQTRVLHGAAHHVDLRGRYEVLSGERERGRDSRRRRRRRYRR